MSSKCSKQLFNIDKYIITNHIKVTSKLDGQVCPKFVSIHVRVCVRSILSKKTKISENESIYLNWTLRYKDFSFRQERFEWKHLRHKTAKQFFSEEIQRYWIQMEERFFKGRDPNWNSSTALSCAPLCAPTFQSRNWWNDCKSKK